ncbi:hypothetical protein FS749_010689 [Ceratobasidium sp. UAMH 11750]|nr:hypothetical protein FS749_010689 [Ceratobasidium sp. UAMH 11750]
MPICTQCTHPVPYLYTVYQSVNNLRLEQCPECLAFADPYVEHDPLTLFLDLILLKREVYRHLLFNRSCEPRRLGTRDTHLPQSVRQKPRSERSWKLVTQLAAGLILLDAFIRWRDRYSPSVAFAQVAIACLLDTVVFHFGVTLACIFLLRAIEWYGAIASQMPSPKPGTRAEFQAPLVSLTLFYSSFTKIFLLLLLAIWQTPVPATSTVSVKTGAGLPDHLANHPFTLHILSLLDEDYFDRAWVIRNVLGGMSAGFGLRVLLDCHPVLTTLVVLFGWLIKSLAAQPIALWTGMGTISEHSIP